MIEKPTWCYKPITNISNLEPMQRELLSLMMHIKPNMELWSVDAVIVPKQDMLGKIPLFENYLKSLNLYDRWHWSLLGYTNNNLSFPIHVDSIGWEFRSFGLNIPVLNCENTYTVFYDADIDKSDEHAKEQNKKYANTDRISGNSPARFIKDGCIPVEIDRIEVSKPYWINHGIPHKPLSNHNKPRAMFSARFEPELHDIINNL